GFQTECTGTQVGYRKMACDTAGRTKGDIQNALYGRAFYEGDQRDLGYFPKDGSKSTDDGHAAASRCHGRPPHPFDYLPDHERIDFYLEIFLSRNRTCPSFSILSI